MYVYKKTGPQIIIKRGDMGLDPGGRTNCPPFRAGPDNTQTGLLYVLIYIIIVF